MSLDPSAKRLIDMLGVLGPNTAGADIATRREGFRNLMRFCPAPAQAGATEDRMLDGPGGSLPLRLYRPAGVLSDRLAGMVFCHGGGLVAGSIETHDALCRTLANETGCLLASVGYRLAPEHKFPAAVEDCLAAALWLRQQAAELGVDPRRIGIGGDSAGGTLAAVVCQMATLSRELRFAFQLLLCPILDFRADTLSRHEFATPLLDDAMMAQDLERYLSEGVDPTDPRVSPLRAASLDGLPRTLLQTAACDPLRDEGRLYAERLAAAGVDVAFTCHPGMPHLFYAMGRVIPHAAVAMKAIGAEVRALG